MAKMLEVKTMNGSSVTAKMAGMESTANTTSVTSTVIRAMNSGVDRQRLLDQVAGGELQGELGAEPEEHDDGKHGGEADPDGAPDRRFLQRDRVRGPMEDAEVEGEHHQHQRNEARPEDGRAHRLH